MNYCFGEYILDTQRRELRHQGHRVAVRPKVFDVLAYLVRHPDQVVGKQTLLTALWPHVQVSPAALSACIKLARQAVGDSGTAQQVIQTCHGRGYRFVAPVAARAYPPPGEPMPPGDPVRGEEREVALCPAPVRPFQRPPYFIGREAALAQLAQCYTTACQGTRQCVVVTGEPGIGKTAVLQTWLAQVAAGDTVWVAHGQCSEPWGPVEPYRPLLDALGRLGRTPAARPLVEVLRQYAPHWLVHLPALLPPSEWAALQRTVGPLGQPQMLRELSDALDVLTTRRPLVLVLEDLHWSDGATLAWLAAVARRPDPARLLLLGTARTGDARGPAQPLRTVLTELQLHGQGRELALDALSDVEVTAYLQARFRHARLAAALTPVLHQRTQGNPLFVRTFVDELLRRQVVQEGAGGWALRGAVATMLTLLPATLQALLAHQLAQWSPEDQTLLAVASVVGVEFPAAAVAAGLACDDDEVEARCATLAQHGQVLEARGHTAWPDGTVTTCFGFRHVLYHALVYQRIPAGHQARWHARIAARLAHGFGAQAGDLAAVVAMHYVRGRRLPEAVPYLRQAGAQALARAAPREARGYFEQALEALASLPAHDDTRRLALELHLALSEALNALGAYARRRTLLDEAAALARALDDQGQLAGVLAQMAHVRRILGDAHGAVVLGQQALALATTLGDRALQVHTAHRLGQSYHVIGDFGQAAAVLRGNVAAATRGSGPPQTDVQIQSQAWLALTLSTLGAFAEGRRAGEAACHRAARDGRGVTPLIAHGCLGLVYLLQGDLAPAIRVLAQSLVLSRASGNRDWGRGILAGLGLASALQGRLAEGRALLEEGLREDRYTGAHHASRVTWLSEVYRLAGRGTEAWQHARQALALARQLTERGDEALALHQLGTVAASADHADVAQADAYYRQALALATELGMRPLQAHCHRGLGMLSATIGQAEQARTALATAIEMYRAMDMTFWLPETEAALAQLAGC